MFLKIVSECGIINRIDTGDYLDYITKGKEAVALMRNSLFEFIFYSKRNKFENTTIVIYSRLPKLQSIGYNQHCMTK